MTPNESNLRGIADGELTIDETIPIDAAQQACGWAMTEIERLRSIEHRWSLIDVLLDGPGHSIEVIAPNEDWGGPAHMIAVTAEWTDWQPERISGDTLEHCLAQAIRMAADAR